ncbi:MAG: hypothetical protein EI684_05290 [Candidatus Viridilinea halotolerans]|uniref:Uncharacterized protein n=1 Tax=Candidatus Viridilinea halotolerans TaxID=2491704 RepID=A0A426U5J6_9CHLR|nr:MAG: hypothetical protein EI684_05290 [Candidatus Viridilinea halotolerans]
MMRESTIYSPIHCIKPFRKAELRGWGKTSYTTVKNTLPFIIFIPTVEWQRERCAVAVAGGEGFDFTRCNTLGLGLGMPGIHQFLQAASAYAYPFRLNLSLQKQLCPPPAQYPWGSW